VTEAHVREQLAQSCYVKVEWKGIMFCPIHYANVHKTTTLILAETLTYKQHQTVQKQSRCKPE